MHLIFAARLPAKSAQVSIRHEAVERIHKVYPHFARERIVAS
jgi:hypothetical protein